MRVRKMTDAAVENALRKRALGYTIEIAEQKVTKDGDVVDLKKDVHIPSDTPAAVFWLKNRNREEWSDKQQIEVTGDFFEHVEKIVKGEA